MQRNGIGSFNIGGRDVVITVMQPNVRTQCIIWTLLTFFCPLFSWARCDFIVHTSLHVSVILSTSTRWYLFSTLFAFPLLRFLLPFKTLLKASLLHYGIVLRSCSWNTYTTTTLNFNFIVMQILREIIISCTTSVLLFI